MAAPPSDSRGSSEPPRFIIGQTALVVCWIALNAVAAGLRWDPYPFILLNLAFSTQAAYAAPLILLAQSRQADRDKVREDVFQQHREEQEKRTDRYEAAQANALAEDRTLNAQQNRMAQQHEELLRQNTALTEQVAHLTRELHATICRPMSE